VGAAGEDQLAWRGRDVTTQQAWGHAPSWEAASRFGCNSADQCLAAEPVAALARSIPLLLPTPQLLLALLAAAHLLLAAGRQWGCLTAGRFAGWGSRLLPATRQAAGLAAGCWTGRASVAAGRHGCVLENTQLKHTWHSSYGSCTIRRPSSRQPPATRQTGAAAHLEGRKGASPGGRQ
jgi:hypothetical protein